MERYGRNHQPGQLAFQLPTKSVLDRKETLYLRNAQVVANANHSILVDAEIQPNLVVTKETCTMHIAVVALHTYIVED